MVGLADIPCVGKLVDRISDAAVDALFRGFRYMFCYKDLVKTLDAQVEKARNEEDRVSTKVAAERANGKIIQDRVFKWQNEAEEIKESAEVFAEKYKNRHSWRCIQCLPIPNPVSRFRLGRAAVQKTERLTELINSGKELLDNEIALLAPNENLPKSTTEFQDFQSRKDVYAELWHALITDSSQILGIYGMPGVGKTRTMEQLWKEAKEKKIFNKVAQGNVGNEKLDVIYLQNQIAGHLDCNFDSEDNAESRASQLRQSLLNAGKTLVILDDVWREIPLDVIGIHCGDENSPMGSKILFTSREENVCLRNNCKTLVKITPLPNDEAWDQFKNIVGTAQIDSMHDESLAKKVCDQCGGLPLLIHAISKALQFETHNSWVDALEQLEKGEFVNIPGVEPQVYACVELSINKLHGDAKSCLFLCCLFDEDADIPIWKLIQLATGSQLVYGKSRVLSMVDTLRSSSLLLNCEEDDSIKLHDIIRDVGRSIAFRDPKFVFSHVTSDVQLLHDANFVTTKFLRLDLDGDNIHIPNDLVCPDLESMWIQCNNNMQQFSGGFFSMSANLRFLFLVGDTYPYLKLQFSLQPLGKLKTLILYNCDLAHINNSNVGFFPENLDTLCILDGEFREPLDLPNLKCLRKLEIKGLEAEMKPNAISSLSRLEELHVPDGLVIWHSESSDVQKPILVEINQLTHLKSLQIKFEISEPFQDTKIFDNLELFNICVGGCGSYLEKVSYKTSIELQGYHEESLNTLVEKAEYVKLNDNDINVSSIFDSNGEAFTELRELHIEECNEMEHLARMSQGEIQHSLQTSFSKLTCLEIKRCSGLRYLFCYSVAKCLTQLQKLIIQDCPVMEAIVINEGSSNGDAISFSRLKELELSEVPRLRSFYRENKDAMMQPFAQCQPQFDRMVEFPNIVKLDISSCGEIKLELIEFSSQLKSLNISCDNQIQLPSEWQPRLHNLETLILNGCWWHDLKSLQFPRLKVLRVCRYAGGSALFTFSGCRSLQQLQQLEILDCVFLEEVAEDDEMSGMNNKTITLSHLSRIVLKDLPKLKSIIHGANYGCSVPSLWKVEVDIPCVGKVVDRISDAAVDALFRGFRYMFRYKDLVKTLDSHVEKANTEEERVSTKVAAERANGKLIKSHVDKWQKEAEEIKESAEKFSEKYKNRHSWRCIQCLPIPNPVSRFRLGREAVQKTERLTELINSGKELLANEIAHLAPPENLPKGNTDFQEFQSRKDSYAELWLALTSDSSPIVGIYGMPGVGKTRMMEHIWKEAKEKMIFNKVTRGNVGNDNLDVIQLQKQIAGYLDCNFVSEDNAESRASQLKQSLLNAGKTLVILDDVWREIPLDVIGIPCGSKILLTSREEKVCLSNKCQTLVKITPLRNDEAWDQFKNIVGSAQIDSLHDESLAKKVCDKCGGLPLLIHAISKALQFETHNSWVDALDQLEKGEFVNIPGVEPQVYACVELSINKLHGDAKSCLFLCCLFPEDANIRIRQLIQLATGSQLVSGESRVLSMVDTLRSSSLLLDCEVGHSIILHDVIRDVGRSIAFRDPKFAFSHVTCDVRLLDDADFVTTKFLRLDLDGDDIHIPDDLVCPHLESMWIQCNNDIQQFSGSFFNMFVNLRFLYLVGGPPTEWLFSLQPLGKLRTLILEGGDLSHINNTNVGFFPENLETLCISCHRFPEPLDLSNLKYLRKLEIEGWKVEIMPNTISSLSSLEELHIPDGFEIWCDDDSSAVAKPILIEINKLTHLKSLQIAFEISEPFQNTNIFDNLKLFHIYVGGGWSYYEKADPSYKTSIQLRGYHEESLNSLVGRAEYVILKDADINVSGIFDSNLEAFTELRELNIEECNKMEHLARMSQGEIEHSQQTSFSKLTCLVIIECSSLRYLFCNSVAKCLTQLQKLRIFNCAVMEAIVINDGSSNGDIISFSQLKELELLYVPRLRGFYMESKDAMMQPLAQFQPQLDRMAEFPNLKKLEIRSCREIKLEWIEFSSQLKKLNISCDDEIQLPSTWQPQLHNLETLNLNGCWWHELKSLQFPRLKVLTVRSYSGGSALFTFSGFRSLQQLQELEISDCAFLQEIAEDVEMSGMNSKTITLSHLEIVVLKNLPKLKSIIHGANYGCRVPSLREVEVRDCALSSLFSFSELTSLHTLRISSCAHLEEIVEDIRNDEVSSMNKKTITLSQLRAVVLTDLPKLKSFIYSANYECLLLPKLYYVSVSDCDLSCLFRCSASGSIQSLVELYVRDCRMLESIFEYVRGDETSGISDQIIFSLSKLKTLELINLPDLKSFIHGANYDCYMPALYKIKVDNCGFSTLFTCSVFRNLQKLGKLEVSNCRLLDVVVENARGDDTNDRTIILPRIESVKLRHLPNLKSFSSDESYAFNMPRLEYFGLVGCPRAQNFSCLNTNTGNGYVSSDEVQRKGVPDLNDYIKRLFKEEDVVVSEMKRLVGP